MYWRKSLGFCCVYFPSVLLPVPGRPIWRYRIFTWKSLFIIHLINNFLPCLWPWGSSSSSATSVSELSFRRLRLFSVQYALRYRVWIIHFVVDKTLWSGNCLDVLFCVVNKQILLVMTVLFTLSHIFDYIQKLACRWRSDRLSVCKCALNDKCDRNHYKTAQICGSP